MEADCDKTIKIKIQEAASSIRRCTAHIVKTFIHKDAVADEFIE